MIKEMPKTYQPQAFEQDIYRCWEENECFKARRDPEKKHRQFTIVMPPPNITGELHMGHALDDTLQDALIRYHRMKGDPTLWLPGTDHAAIATENRIAERLHEEGLSKKTIGREAFLKRAWEWRDLYGGRITEQIRRLGASCDWSRERFTMDEGLSRAVNVFFERLYQKGLIYRGNRIINWCTTCKTALSDAEVEYEEQAGKLWFIRYPGEDGSAGVVVATTRPETMLGDTGVAAHPDDPRYAHLKDTRVILPLMDRPIPVIFDEYVEKEFGTGAVKMTPAHDPNDFEIAVRHGLPFLRVINDDGTMNENAGPYQGLSGLEAREKILKDLEARGLLVKTEAYTHNVGGCYRCHHTVEPLLSLQWFVKMKPLAEPAIRAVKNKKDKTDGESIVREKPNGEKADEDKSRSDEADGGYGKIRFLPQRFESVYLNWMENIRDWCISRQLWWGHRIPAYYCDECGEMTVSADAPQTCKCGARLRQDEDVLDTWFSSALWPFSTLGWPGQTDDLQYFYPTSTLVTAYDIIFFWVARMIFSGIELTGKSPFDTVMIHGLIRDEKGRKMSKSLGNGINPLDVIDTHGADALRFSLVYGLASGNDINFSMDRVEAARNFANKVYNASRFVLINLEGEESIGGKALDLSDQWILTRLNDCVRETTAHMEAYDLGLAASCVYDFAWSEFCDWYIEWAKPRLLGDGAQKKTAQAVLLHCLKGLLKLLHPFMPFVTESIWRELPSGTNEIPPSESGEASEKGLLMISAWPEYDETLYFPKEAALCSGIMEAIKSVRGLRAEMKVEPSRRVRLVIKPADEEWRAALRGSESAFQRLCGAASIEATSNKEGIEAGDGKGSAEVIENKDSTTVKTVSIVCPAAEIFIPLGDLVDIARERVRLEKEKQSIENEIFRAEKMLNNPGYLSKAPEALIAATREKLEQNRRMLEKVTLRFEEAQLP